MKHDMPASLDAQLAKLSREVPPPRDLWPGVVRGIVRTPRAPARLVPASWMAYAASAAGLCLAAALAWVLVHGRLTASGAPLSAGNVPATAARLGEPHDPRYLAARAELERTFDQRLEQLDPVTRAKIAAAPTISASACACPAPTTPPRSTSSRPGSWARREAMFI